MKNFEKWEKEILEITKTGNIVALKNGKPIICNIKNIECNKCGFNSERECFVTRMLWFYQEYIEKPKLNKYEKAFCEALNNGYIARDLDGSLFVFEKRPSKANETWRGDCFYVGFSTIKTINPKLKFNFVKWEDREPWSIKELLKLEIEDE